MSLVQDRSSRATYRAWGSWRLVVAARSPLVIEAGDHAIPESRWRDAWARVDGASGDLDDALRYCVALNSSRRASIRASYGGARARPPLWIRREMVARRECLICSSLGGALTIHQVRAVVCRACRTRVTPFRTVDPLAECWSARWRAPQE